MERKILDAEQLTTAIKTLDGWTVEGKLLRKHFKFENFVDALCFVNQVGDLAETADHHPDVTFGWGYADIVLTTHDRGGITDADTDLAAKIDHIG